MAPRSPALPALPIDEVLPALVSALKSHPAVVLQAPPGAGKTTRVPLAILDAGLQGDGQIVMLEPRRIAARAAASTLAKNRGEVAGDTVGYKVRFDEKSSRNTRVMVVTEGILTRRLITDPFLEGVNVVLLDEFHERSIHTDLALCFLRELQEVRSDLKLVVMSATLDAQGVAAYLGNAPIITSQGRPFPVVVTHQPKDDRRLEERVVGAVRRLIKAHDDDGGDVLCFLPGAPEIQRCLEQWKSQGDPDVDGVPLFGALSPREQDRAIERGLRRKVIFSTNVAETSLTIEGVSVVVDSGLMKAARFDAATDRSVLETVRISRASADQRAGRAGRTRPGRCLRLYSEAELAQMAASHPPEIARADLARTALDVLSFHPGDLRQVQFLEMPPRAALDRALSVLRLLGATDEAGRALSARGKQLAALPLSPRAGAVMLQAAALDAVEEGALLAAILEDDRVIERGAARATTDSDLATVVDRLWAQKGQSNQRPAERDVLRAADDIERQATRHLHVGDERKASEDARRKRMLLSAFPDRVCKRRKPGEPDAVMVGGQGVRQAKESGVDAPLFLALSIEGGDSKAGLVRTAEGITEVLLEELFPALLTTRTEAVFDEERQAMAGVRRRRFADLILEEKHGVAVDADVLSRGVAAAFLERFDRAFRPDEHARAVRARLRFAAQHLPEAELPGVEDEDLKALVPELCVGLKSFAAVQAIDWGRVLLDRLSYAQKKLLDDEVPARITVPTGNAIAVDYEEALRGGAPVLAVRLQELFGLERSPHVARGRVGVVFHLLSPGYKPVQVTRDLASFWKNTYPEVKKELRARYPRHSWPDDPLTAAPTARALRRR